MKKKVNFKLDHFKKVEIAKCLQVRIKGGLEIIVINDTIDG